jgi:hypothetical protein
VVILIVHVVAVTTVKSERYPPPLIDIHCPLTLPAALERVKPQPRRIQISDVGRGLKSGKNSADLRHMVRAQGPRIARFEEPLQSAVPEPG